MDPDKCLLFGLFVEENRLYLSHVKDLKWSLSPSHKLNLDNMPDKVYASNKAYLIKR